MLNLKALTTAATRLGLAAFIATALTLGNGPSQGPAKAATNVAAAPLSFGGFGFVVLWVLLAVRHQFVSSGPLGLGYVISRPITLAV